MEGCIIGITAPRGRSRPRPSCGVGSCVWGLLTGLLWVNVLVLVKVFVRGPVVVLCGEVTSVLAKSVVAVCDAPRSLAASGAAAETEAPSATL